MIGPWSMRSDGLGEWRERVVVGKGEILLGIALEQPTELVLHLNVESL